MPEALICGAIDFGPGDAPTLSHSGMRVTGSGVDVHLRAPANVAVTGARVALATGTPRFAERASLAQSDAAIWLSRWQQHGEDAAAAVKGAYSVVLLDFASRKALLATDRFSIQPLCYAWDGRRLRFADRADAVLPYDDQRIDAQAIYDYLYFHVVAAPRTIFSSVKRLPGGHALSIDGDCASVSPYWIPAFTESASVSMRELAGEFT